jgi:3-oxoacyl-[acyl-carrier protein] reductase
VGKLEGRVAVVTGAASGIGRGIAGAFAREGADVAVVDICAERQAAGVLADIAAHGRAATFAHCDVSDEAAVDAMAQHVLDRFGHADILVNNAGIFTQSLLADMPVADWDRVIGVNLRGTFLCTRVFLRPMLDRGWGRVINIASQLGQIGGAEVAHYSASKAGVIGLTKALAREVSGCWSTRSPRVPSRRLCWIARPSSGAAPSWPSSRWAGSARWRRSHQPLSCWHRRMAPTTRARRWDRTAGT